MPAKHTQPSQSDLATQAFQAGRRSLSDSPMLRSLMAHTTIYRRNDLNNLCPPTGWAVVSADGTIYVHPTRRAEPEEWTYVLAHCLLHLGFGHFEQSRFKAHEWNVACDYYVARFLADLKLGRSPVDLPDLYEFSASSEERLFGLFGERGAPDYLRSLSPAGPQADCMIFESPRLDKEGKPFDWPALFGMGLTQAVTQVVEAASGDIAVPGMRVTNKNSRAQQARAWFINNYPLLGALAASFEIIEDQLLCDRLKISVAAVNAELQEIYINPYAQLSSDEMRFVIAHELLHVGLRHDERQQGRDHYYWNVACDFVINGWLVEMGLGELPNVGGLYDPDLKNQSAEALYDLIVNDLRRFRHLATLRGVGLGDMLEDGPVKGWATGQGCDLDEFYRRCLAQGLQMHQNESRGYLPAGLIEQIRALSQPPIPWDVELAHWFDRYFEPLEQRRSYMRLSRRQSSTPDIPRPSSVPTNLEESGRTFGVVLDTSGSMDRELLAKALGAIASYSATHDVPAARVIFCDAAAYDQGYMPLEAIADQVKVRGRGGTVLQPGIDLLETAPDFPPEGPILIITDGFCDRIRVRREHAFLLPAGRTLPFAPKGPLFRLK